jgi:hypothetical protein
MNITTAKMQFGVSYDVGYIASVHHFNVDPVADAIAYGEKWEAKPGSPVVTHSFVVIGIDRTEEAFASGVGRGTLTNYLNANTGLYVRRPFGWTPELGASIATAAQAHHGDAYNFALIAADAANDSLFGQLLDLETGGAFGRFVQRMAAKPHQEICSQLSAMALQAQPEFAGKGILATQSVFGIDPESLFMDDSLFEAGATRLTA